MIKGKTGYLYTSTNDGCQARIPWTQYYDIEGNYSILELGGEIYSSMYARVYILEGTIAAAGSNVLSMAYANGYRVNTNYNTGVWLPITNSAGTKAGPWQSVKIQHDDEGKATAVISASIQGYAQSYQGNTGDDFSVSGSATVELATIPRASTIGATDANIGAVSVIAVSRKGSSFTHSIKYELGGLTGYITSDGGVSSTEVKFSETSIPFTVPTSFYAQIPNAETGTCKLTCITYSGDTQIGSAQTATFTVTASESACRPTVSGTVVDSNEATKALTGDAGKLVRYYSTALCTIYAAAQNSAAISQKKIGGVAVSEDTRSIAGIEASAISFEAVDSRGYGASVSVNFVPVNFKAGTLLMMESTDYPGCFYRSGNGVIEWINPPLALGTEYATAERYAGRRVYQKLIDGGAMPNATIKTISTEILNGMHFVSLDVCFGSGGTLTNIMPVEQNSAGYPIKVRQASITRIIVETQTDESGCTAYLLLKYTKTTE